MRAPAEYVGAMAEQERFTVAIDCGADDERCTRVHAQLRGPDAGFAQAVISGDRGSLLVVVWVTASSHVDAVAIVASAVERYVDEPDRSQVKVLADPPAPDPTFAHFEASDARCDEPGCRGFRLAGIHCLAHLSAPELAEATKRLRAGEQLDARNTTITSVALQALLKAMRVDDARAELPAADFRGATFSDAARFDGVRFTGDVSFVGVTFAARAGFSEARFAGQAGFDGATFFGHTAFNGARFDGRGDFRGASFRGRASFEAARFGARAGFDGSTFDAHADFGAVHFEDTADFDGSTFEAPSSFAAARFGAHAGFAGTVVNDTIDFAGASFAEPPNLVGAVFPDDVPPRFDLTVGTDPAITVGTRDGADNDMVSEVDQLGFQRYVDAFADLIASPHTKPPLTIGIFGSWGMGKSFLLKHIDDEICARQRADPATRPKVHVVRFNAWEYSAADVVWPSLVRKIVQTLDAEVPYPRWRRRWTRLRWNLPWLLHQGKVPLVGVGLVAAIAIVSALVGDESRLAAGVAGVLAIGGVGGIVKAAKDPLARWITAAYAESDYGRQRGHMEEIKHDLEQLEHRLHDGVTGKPSAGRILIVIDDLDRCEPSKTVEVLQAVNLLLGFPTFIVCLGIDARIVTGAVEKHYEGLLGAAGASGYEYLEKIIQIPFRIPEPGPEDVVKFISEQLGRPTRPAPGARAPAAETGTDRAERPDGRVQSVPVPPADAVLEAVAPTSAGLKRLTTQPLVDFTYDEFAAFERFAPYLRPNPRHLKRLVNVYRLVRALARAQDERLILDRPEVTIRWLVMWAQWPYASSAMVDRFDYMLAHGEISTDAESGDPMLDLLDAVEPDLHADLRARLDDDSGRLRELLSVDQCGPTWGEIQRIHRYTVNLNPAVTDQIRDARRPGAQSQA